MEIRDYLLSIKSQRCYADKVNSAETSGYRFAPGLEADLHTSLLMRLLYFKHLALNAFRTSLNVYCSECIHHECFM